MRKIVFVNNKAGYFSGVERFIANIVPVLAAHDYEIYGVFEERTEQSEAFLSHFKEVYFTDEWRSSDIFLELQKHEVSIAFIHKIFNNQLVSGFLQHAFKLITFIHDHDYYCPRRFKYFPIKQINCSRPFVQAFCGICSFFSVKDMEKHPLSISQMDTLLDTIKKSRQYLVLSNPMKENLKANGFKSKRMSRLYPIQTLPETTGTDNPSDAHEILFIGRHIKDKGIDLLIKAAQHIKSDFTLRFVGTGNYSEIAQSMVKEHKLENKIIFEGWQEDIEPFLRQADIVVVPSRWQEPFGLVGVEAMSYAKPVVAFDVGGISEWLKHGSSGYLIPPYDVKKMAARIDELLEDEQKRKEFGAFAYDYVRHYYSEDTFIQKFNEIFDNVYVEDPYRRSTLK